MTDWRDWHSKYDDPDSSLSRRLEVVRLGIASALAHLAGRSEISALSLCAGEGRVLLPELAALEGHATYRAVLVERDEVLARGASDRAASLGLANVHIVVGDAGCFSTFSSYSPVDLLLLCGIFGNIPRAEIEATVAAAPSMLHPGGFVVWTRGGPNLHGKNEPDLRPWVRSLFSANGFEEVDFTGDPEPYGVGVARLTKAPGPRRAVPEQLFAFTH